MICRAFAVEGPLGEHSPKPPLAGPYDQTDRILIIGSTYHRMHGTRPVPHECPERDVKTLIYSTRENPLRDVSKRLFHLIDKNKT